MHEGEIQVVVEAASKSVEYVYLSYYFADFMNNDVDDIQSRLLLKSYVWHHLVDIKKGP